MTTRTRFSLIVASCGAAAVAGVIGLGVGAQVVNGAESGTPAGENVAPVAVTKTPMSFAPAITGPAPLPPEMEGLPG